VIGLRLNFWFSATMYKKFPFTFRARTITNGFIGEKLNLDHFVLEQLFLSGPNKIVLKIKTLLRQVSVRSFQILIAFVCECQH